MEAMHHNKHTLKGRLFLKLYILSKCDQIFLSNSWASCLAFALVFCFLTKCNRLNWLAYRALSSVHYITLPTFQLHYSTDYRSAAYSRFLLIKLLLLLICFP